MVLMSRLTCDTETPIRAGPIRVAMRRTPGSAQAARQLRVGRGSMAIFFRADEYRPGQGQYGRVEIGRGEQRHGDEGNVEQHWREGGQGEAAPAVEEAAGEGDQRHEENVGEGDAGQRDGEFELAGIGAEAGGGNPDQQRCGGNADGGDGEQRHRQQAGHVVDQGAGVFRAALVLVFAKNGHESLREGAFREHPAQQVGQLEGDEKGVGRQSGAKSAGNDEIANKAENPRQQGHSADGGQRAKQIHGLVTLPEWGQKSYNSTLCLFESGESLVHAGFRPVCRCSSVGRATDS